jgi:quercetin dioxygenase-like cupin family protein
MTPVDRSNATHYVWGGNCDGWHLLAGEDLSVIEERVPPGASEVRHRHARSRQFFYVLAGEVRIEADGVEHRLAPGQGLHVAPGTAHRLFNADDGDARFLVVSSPRSHGDREELPA